MLATVPLRAHLPYLRRRTDRRCRIAFLASEQVDANHTCASEAEGHHGQAAMQNCSLFQLYAKHMEWLHGQFRIIPALGDGMLPTPGRAGSFCLKSSGRRDYR